MTDVEKLVEQWKNQLKYHQDRLKQGQDLVIQENKFISMIEGGIQFGESLLKQSSEEVQKSGIVEIAHKSEKAQSKK